MFRNSFDRLQVLKRLSNPLSWMDSFNSDSGAGSGVAFAGGSGGSFSSGGGNTPPILGGGLPSSSTGALHHHDPNDPKGGGVLSSVFNMTSNVTSNVSNMLTRLVFVDLLHDSTSIELSTSLVILIIHWHSQKAGYLVGVFIF